MTVIKSDAAQKCVVNLFGGRIVKNVNKKKGKENFDLAVTHEFLFVYQQKSFKIRVRTRDPERVKISRDFDPRTSRNPQNTIHKPAFFEKSQNKRFLTCFRLFLNFPKSLYHKFFLWICESFYS